MEDSKKENILESEYDDQEEEESEEEGSEGEESGSYENCEYDDEGDLKNPSDRVE